MAKQVRIPKLPTLPDQASQKLVDAHLILRGFAISIARTKSQALLSAYKDALADYEALVLLEPLRDPIRSFVPAFNDLDDIDVRPPYLKRRHPDSSASL